MSCVRWASEPRTSHGTRNPILCICITCITYAYIPIQTTMSLDLLQINHRVFMQSNEAMYVRMYNLLYHLCLVHRTAFDVSHAINWINSNCLWEGHTDMIETICNDGCYMNSLYGREPMALPLIHVPILASCATSSLVLTVTGVGSASTFWGNRVKWTTYVVLYICYT